MTRSSIRTAPRTDIPTMRIVFLKHEATLLAVLGGFWTLDDQHRYVAETGQWIERLRTQGKWFAIMVDVTQFPVQSQEVSAAFGSTLDLGRAPAAIVARAGITVLQAKRIGTAAHVRVFTDRQAAADWIESVRPNSVGDFASSG